MQSFGEKQKPEKDIEAVKIYPVPFSLEEIQKKSKFNKIRSTKYDKEYIVDQAFRYHSQGNLLEATKYYQYFLDQGFTDPRVFSNYGAICEQLGERNKAEELYKKSIHFFPNSPESYANLGIILKKVGDLKQAEIYTRKAISIKPNFADAYHNLGSIFVDLEQPKEAELYLRKAIKLKPNLAEAHCNLGVTLTHQNKTLEAEKYLRQAIKIKPSLAVAHNNLGTVLKELGELKEAEISTSNAIKLNPNSAEFHMNLGYILINLGKLKQAEISTIKSLKLKPTLAKGYYNLSILGSFSYNSKFIKNLFSDSLFSKANKKEKVDIYFARANILHKQKNYTEAGRCLQIANSIKLKLYPSDIKTRLRRSKELAIESNNYNIKKSAQTSKENAIFIVGMPRSGSTLVESILSMNKQVSDLGETNVLSELFLSWQKKSKEGKKLNLEELYLEKISKFSSKSTISTNKMLYNYQYVGVIASQINCSKIIHCFRNPLDNILSIYRANFSKGNSYSSSLEDSAILYLNQKERMREYKKSYRSKIYDLDYDLLVKEPHSQIKSLISWLGWEWDNSYLSPHLNTRSISTASSVQVRSPINSKSISGWKNYKEILSPAIEILEKQ